MSYTITGKIEGKKFSFSTFDYEFALKIFKKNNLKNFWLEDSKTGKRKLLLKNEVLS